MLKVEAEVIHRLAHDSRRGPLGIEVGIAAGEGSDCQWSQCSCQQEYLRRRIDANLWGLQAAAAGWWYRWTRYSDEAKQGNLRNTRFWDASTKKPLTYWKSAANFLGWSRWQQCRDYLQKPANHCKLQLDFVYCDAKIQLLNGKNVKISEKWHLFEYFVV